MNPIAYYSLRKLVKRLKDISIKPVKIRTEAEAKMANIQDKDLGLPGGWKVGDEYYEAKELLLQPILNSLDDFFFDIRFRIDYHAERMFVGPILEMAKDCYFAEVGESEN